MEFRPARSLLPCALAWLLAGPAPGATIKKWVDENGVTHYGTTIPPQYVDKAHEELNERGIPVKRVERAKTAAEIARERELEALRREQQRIVEEQRARDRILLNLYRSEDDLILVRNGKLSQIDAQIRLKKAHIERLRRQLSEWQAKAAARERKGLKPTEKQLENLRNIQKQMENTYAGIVEREADKKRITAQYQRELERFRQLKHGFRANSPSDVEPVRKPPKIIPVDGAVVCRNSEQCDRLWPLAKQWAREHATTPVEVVGERILVTQAASKPTDISMTVSRLKRGGVERIFLDPSCMNSVSGRNFCQRLSVKDLPRQFVKAMQQYIEQDEAASTTE